MDLAFQHRPFRFDRVFTAPVDDSEDEDAPIRIAELEATLARLQIDHAEELARSRADGFAAGLTHARTEREAALLAAVDALGAGVETLENEQAAARETMLRDAAALALAAAEHLAGRALHADPNEAIDAAIGRALAQVMRGQEIFIHVHPDFAVDIEERIAQRQAGDRRRLNLHVIADPALAVGDARLDWDKGGLILDREARAAALRAELEALTVG